MPKTVLITGCSSGIGKSTAEFFAANGWNVSATMRDPGSAGAAEEQLAALPNVVVPLLDVRDRESINRAVASTVEKFGTIDVVVNNAGFLLSGPAEFATKEQVMDQLETNVYGPLAVTQAVLPHFRSKGTGLIVNVSSTVGRFAFPFMAVYVASKHAVEGLSEALNLELVPLGVRVKLVEPGTTETDIWSHMQMASRENDVVYAEAAQKASDSFSEEPINEKSTPELVASAIYEAAIDGLDTVRYPVGRDTLKLNEIRKSMTDEEWEKYLLSKFNLLGAPE